MCQIGPDKDFTKHFGCVYFLPRFISFICAIHVDNNTQYLHRMDHNEGCKIQIAAQSSFELSSLCYNRPIDYEINNERSQ